MKALVILLTCLIVAASAVAQTDVDRLATGLVGLSTAALDGWKVSPDLKQAGAFTSDPTVAGFDDTRWDALTLNQRIYTDSCWIRKEIAIPEKFMGQNVSGTVKLLVSVDDYGYMWINGQSKGYFPWDGEFVLTNDAKPGQKFLIAIKAVNTGGPLRLIRAEIVMEKVASAVTSIRDFALSLRVAQKLLSFDTYQTNARQRTDPGTDKSEADREEKTKLNALLQSLARDIDVTLLKEGKVELFTKSIDNVRTRLQPVRDFVKRFTLVFNANAHIDAAWLWRERETVEVCKNTFTSVLNMMDSRPDFTYTQSSALYYDWMEKQYPEVLKRIKNRVKEGRWEISGGMWIEPDCNLISGESWMRQLLYAKKYFREKFGVDVKIGWNPDSFGYNWNMPQFYVQAGIDAFITQKIGWNEKNVFPYRCFWWEAPDGSRILSYFPFDYVNIVDDPYKLVDWLRQYEANTGFMNMMILFGVGDHGGGPSNDMLDRIEHLKKLDIYPNVEYGTTNQYLDWLKAQDLSSLPVWKDELYLEYHQGTFTTQAKVKEWNRKSETLLTNLEKFSTFAYQNGGKYGNDDIEEAWKHVLLNQFHDILPGSSIREVYIDAAERYESAATIGNFELSSALNYLSGLAKTDAVKNAKPVLLFNALNWERSDVAAVALPPGEKGDFTVVGFNGKEIPSQVIQRSKYNRDLLFKTDGVPPMGYEAYYLIDGKPSARIPGLNVTKEKIENEFFTVLVDQTTGWIKSIVDKRNGREILSGPGNVLCLLEDKPAQWDAWNVGLTGVQYPTMLRNIEVSENGPVRATIRITHVYLTPGLVREPPTPNYPSSFFTQSVTLYEGVDQIFFTIEADWWEEKTMVKVAFPVSVNAPVASYEIPYGSIQRSTQWKDRIDSGKVEVPAQRWVDLSQDDYGVSLLSRAKYGYDIKGNVIRLSLLRSPKWPDPTADRGKHRIEYSLYPHAGDWRKAETVRRGYEYNNPLNVVFDRSHKGRLPSKYSFVHLTPSNLVLTTVKKAETGDAVIYQWYDAEGKESTASLKLTGTPKKVVMSNFLEEDGKPLVIKKDILEIPSGKNAVVTVKVYY